MTRFRIASILGLLIALTLTLFVLLSSGEQGMSMRNGVGLALSVVTILGYGPLVIDYVLDLVRQRDGSPAYTFLGVGIVANGLGWLVLLLRPEYFSGCSMDEPCFNYWLAGATFCWVIALVFKSLALILEPRVSRFPVYFALIVAVTFGLVTAVRGL